VAAPKPEKKVAKKTKTSKKVAPDIPERRNLLVTPLVPETASGRERVSVKEAYDYYVSKCERAFSVSWMRSKIAKGEIFDAIKVPDNGPKGHAYLVSLDSVDQYLSGDPKGRTTPEYVNVETAYHRLNEDEIPAHMSLLQFKRLVKSGVFETTARKGVTKVSIESVREYFRGDPDPDSLPSELGVAEAHAYYCSRVSDPVAKAHFARWVYDGTIADCQKTGGTWTVPVSSVDAFIDEYPKGRLRTNRNSASRKKKPKKNALAAIVDDVASRPDEDDDVEVEEDDDTRVAVSISDYSGPDELKQAIQLLTEQGIKVDVRP
jgi:hypothetical protein